MRMVAPHIGKLEKVVKLEMEDKMVEYITNNLQCRLGLLYNCLTFLFEVFKQVFSKNNFQQFYLFHIYKSIYKTDVWQSK